MTNQEVKEYLKSYQELNKAINRKLDELSRLKSLAMKVTVTYSDMPKGGGSLRDDVYAKMIDLNDEINADIDRFTDKRKEVEKFIEQVGNSKVEEVLKYYYINGMTWDKVAEVMNWEIDGRYVYQIHRNALKKLSTLNYTLDSGIMAE